MDTLVLNADSSVWSFLPLSGITWMDAIKLYYLDKVQILDYYSDWVVNSPSVKIQVPSVIMMKKYYNPSRGVEFNRYNVYLRDNFKCQYCGIELYNDISSLTYDHVLPKSHGGKTTWTNIVSCCFHCNGEKGNNYKIQPKIKPKVPTYWEMVKKKKNYPIRIPDSSWIPYLDWSPNLIYLTKSSVKKILN